MIQPSPKTFKSGVSSARATSGRASIKLLVSAVVVAILAISIGFGVLLKNPDLLYTFGTQRSNSVMPASGYGFATNLAGLSDTDLSKRLDDIRATGVTWVRYDISWADVQPNSADSSDWSSYDTITKAATGHGMKIIMIIDFAPPWAQAPGCNTSQICAPADPIAYAKFAGEVATHYKSFGVSAYEIWNEPNTAVRFEPTANPALYVRMLKDSYASIKRADSSAIVITGGTAPSSTRGTNYSPADFMKALYSNGAAGWFDAVAVHPYTFPISPTQSKPSDAWGQLTTIHNMMSSYGDGNKQIWATEFGAPTNGPDAGQKVSESSQAQMITDAIRIFHSYTWGGPLFLYDYIDSGSTTDTNENFYGLVRADGTHKPSYNSFVQAIAGNK